MTVTQVQKEVQYAFPASLPQMLAEEIWCSVPEGQREDVMNLVAWFVEATDDPILLDQTIDILHDVVKTAPSVRSLVGRYLPQETKDAVTRAMKSYEPVVPFSKRNVDHVFLARSLVVAYETGEEALYLAVDLLRAASLVRPELKRRVWENLHPDVQARIRSLQKKRTAGEGKD